MGIEERAKRLVTGLTGRGEAPPPRVRDAKGKVLEIGDEVLLVTPSHEMRVASIRPVLQTGAPPNLMEVILVTKLNIIVPRDQGVESLYHLRHAAELKDGVAFPGQGQQQASDETQA